MKVSGPVNKLFSKVVITLKDYYFIDVQENTGMFSKS